MKCDLPINYFMKMIIYIKKKTKYKIKMVNDYYFLLLFMIVCLTNHDIDNCME